MFYESAIHFEMGCVHYTLGFVRFKRAYGLIKKTISKWLIINKKS